MTLDPIEIYRDWRRKTATRRALYALSDQQLRDIGIQRGEVEAAARGGLPRGARFTH